MKKAELDASGGAGGLVEVAAKFKALKQAIHARRLARGGDFDRGSRDSPNRTSQPVAVNLRDNPAHLGQKFAG